DRVRAAILDIRARTVASRHVSDEDYRTLKAIFGEANLVDAGLTAPDGGPHRPHGHQVEAAVEGLVASERTLLAKKVRQVELIEARARSGLVLGDVEIEEIGLLFGPPFADGLQAEDN